MKYREYLPVFSGGDLNAVVFVNGRQLSVSNLESVCFTTSVEYWKENGEEKFGEKTHVGSLMLTQFDCDGLAEMLELDETDDPVCIPKFDLIVYAVNSRGDSAFCMLFGVRVVQKTVGFSAADLGNTMGVSFVADHIVGWRPGYMGALQDTCEKPF